MTYKLDTTHTGAAENIINYALLKGLAERTVQFLEPDLFRVVHIVGHAKTPTGENLFDTGSAWAEHHGDEYWRCDDGSAHLSFLKATERGFDYETNDFYLKDDGKKYIADNACRFALENRPAAQELAKAIGTDLESILHTALGFIVAKDPYESPKKK